ncbi:MAG: hypothetical protein WBB74_10430 [Gaiellaceae bacterium]
MAGFRTMEASSLTRQAHQAGDKIKQDIPLQYKSELASVITELTGRVDFVAKGQPPKTKTNYQALEASALAQQARHVISQIARNIPVDKRDSLGIIETLADRVEFAAIGAPATVSARTTTGARTPAKTRKRTTRRAAVKRSRPMSRPGPIQSEVLP